MRKSLPNSPLQRTYTLDAVNEVDAEKVGKSTEAVDYLPGFLPDADAAWVIEKTRKLLSGQLSQAAFAERLDVSRQAFEKVLSGKHRLTRRVAEKIFSQLCVVADERAFTIRKRRILLRMRSVLNFYFDLRRRAESRLIIAHLVRGGIVAPNDVPAAVSIADDAFDDLSLNYRYGRGDTLSTLRSETMCAQLTFEQRAELRDYFLDEMDYPTNALTRINNGGAYPEAN